MKNRYFKRIFVLIFVISLSLFIISCASGPGDEEEEGADTGSVILAALETTGKVANGEDSYTITAQVLDTSGKPLADQSVTFTATGNTGLVAINLPVTTTGADGTATCDVADISSQDDIVYISASSGGVNSVGSIGLAFAGSAGGVEVKVGSVILAASETTGKVADGTDSYTVTAQVLDTSGKPLADQSVTFTAKAIQALLQSTRLLQQQGQMALQHVMSRI